MSFMNFPPSPPCNQRTSAGFEPDLREVLADPLVHLVMQRDGVTPCDLHRVIARAKAKMRRGACRHDAA
jgi:hypothetical protein